jgi:hypothetical protein
MDRPANYRIHVQNGQMLQGDLMSHVYLGLKARNVCHQIVRVRDPPPARSCLADGDKLRLRLALPRALWWSLWVVFGDQHVDYG